MTPGPKPKALKFPRYRDGSVEAGLWALSQRAKLGQTYSYADIGKVCGRSHEWVRKIQNKALRKLKRALKRHMQIIEDREFTALQEIDAAKKE